MKPYNFRRNPKPLTPNDIENGKNFNEVLKAAGKPPLITPSALKWMGIGLSSLAVLLGLYFGLSNNTEPETSFVQPLGPVPFTSALINPEKDTLLHLSTGSTIFIPAFSVVNKDGTPSKGPVEIKYREFRNVGDILLAGIPMTFDSNEARYHFESSGMFELLAFSGDNPLMVAPGKNITVRMASLNSKDSYNQYYLDTIAKNWVPLGKDNKLFYTGDSVEVGNLKGQNLSKENWEPIKPVVLNPKAQQFRIEVDPKEFPEIAVFGETIFEVVPSEIAYDPATAELPWSDVSIERTAEKDYFLISFSGNGQTLKILARPVVSKSNYVKEMARYEELYKNYLRLEKLQAQSGPTAILEKELSRYKALENQRVADMERAAFVEGRNNTNKSVVYSVFSVQQFGIFNSDYPLKLPNARILQPVFAFENGKQIPATQYFLAEMGRNNLYTFKGGDKIQFDSEVSNLLVVLLNDGSVGLFPASEFGKIPSHAREYKFVLEKVETSELSSKKILSMFNI